MGTTAAASPVDRSSPGWQASRTEAARLAPCWRSGSEPWEPKSSSWRASRMRGGELSLLGGPAARSRSCSTQWTSPSLQSLRMNSTVRNRSRQSSGVLASHWPPHSSLSSPASGGRFRMKHRSSQPASCGGAWSGRSRRSRSAASASSRTSAVESPAPASSTGATDHGRKKRRKGVASRSTASFIRCRSARPAQDEAPCSTGGLLVTRATLGPLRPEGGGAGFGTSSRTSTRASTSRGGHAVPALGAITAEAGANGLPPEGRSPTSPSAPPPAAAPAHSTPAIAPGPAPCPASSAASCRSSTAARKAAKMLASTAPSGPPRLWKASSAARPMSRRAAGSVTRGRPRSRKAAAKFRRNGDASRSDASLTSTPHGNWTCLAGRSRLEMWDSTSMALLRTAESLVLRNGRTCGRTFGDMSAKRTSSARINRSKTRCKTARGSATAAIAPPPLPSRCWDG
mmetsp:Transcript_20010/g.58475  ORF Transcript_20010/g.58475 Transcript_20010/m.58475 type:complete len:456 (-) Transcript_20010:14-1381(-)